MLTVEWYRVDFKSMINKGKKRLGTGYLEIKDIWNQILNKLWIVLNETLSWKTRILFINFYRIFVIFLDLFLVYEKNWKNNIKINSID